MLKEMESGSNKSNLRILEVMAEDCGDLGELWPTLAANFAITAMPAVIVFADGEVRMFSFIVFSNCCTNLGA